ncbi:MAG: hypothetical protein ACYDDF_08915 [Thermoplasmatota archaeon]
MMVASLRPRAEAIAALRSVANNEKAPGRDRVAACEVILRNTKPIEDVDDVGFYDRRFARPPDIEPPSPSPAMMDADGVQKAIEIMMQQRAKAAETRSEVDPEI